MKNLDWRLGLDELVLRLQTGALTALRSKIQADNTEDHTLFNRELRTYQEMLRTVNEIFGTKYEQMPFVQGSLIERPVKRE